MAFKVHRKPPLDSPSKRVSIGCAKCRVGAAQMGGGRLGWLRVTHRIGVIFPRSICNLSHRLGGRFRGPRPIDSPAPDEYYGLGPTRRDSHDDQLAEDGWVLPVPQDARAIPAEPEVALAEAVEMACVVVSQGKSVSPDHVGVLGFATSRTQGRLLHRSPCPRIRTPDLRRGPRRVHYDAFSPQEALAPP